MDTLAKGVNNPQLLEPTFYLGHQTVDKGGATVVDIYVPASSQAHRYKGMVYDRSSDGDFKVKNQKLISDLYIRKQESYTENRIFPYLEIEDFDREMLDLARKLLSLNRSDHPWLTMTHEEMLKAARLHRKDLQTGQKGYTMAAALLFGSESTIASVLPHYKTDALCRKQDLVLYDDRDDIRCNLMRAYYRLLEFAQKHLPQRVYIDGTQRVSLREIIFRELIANLLVHREYSNSYPATLCIYDNKVVSKNWNRPFVSGLISFENLSPHPKNPTIAHFFKQLGWVEELGSGVRKTYRYVPAYADGQLPVIQDGDLFTITIPYLDDDGSINDEKGSINPESEPINDADDSARSTILAIITQHGGLNTPAISERLNLNKLTVRKHLQAMVKAQLIEYRGARKNGGYYLHS